MSGFTRVQKGSILALGLALLFVPVSLGAQTAEERARERELREKLEQRLQSMHQERLAHLEEALARAKEELAHAQEQRQEFQVARLEYLEQALAEAREEMEQGYGDEERIEQFIAQRMQAQEDVRARLEEARLRQQEVQERQRVQAREIRERTAEIQERARAQARDQVRRVQQVVVQLRTRLRLGISLDGTQAEEYDAQGARIQDVIEDTPAEEAGLMEGDIVTHLNGQSLLDPLPDEAEREFDEDGSLPVQRLLALAREVEAGDEVEVRYLRDGAAQVATFEAADLEDPRIRVFRGGEGSGGVFRFDPEERGVWSFTLPDREAFWLQLRGLEDLDELKDMEIELKELEDLELKLEDLDIDIPDLRVRALPRGALQGLVLRGGEGSPLVYGGMGWGARHGLRLTEMNPGLAEYFSTDAGVLVLEVDEGSGLGLIAGDVILSIDGRDVEDQGDVGRILGSYEDGESVTFTVVRHGQERQVQGTIE